MYQKQPIKYTTCPSHCGKLHVPSVCGCLLCCNGRLAPIHVHAAMPEDMETKRMAVFSMSANTLSTCTVGALGCINGLLITHVVRLLVRCFLNPRNNQGHHENCWLNIMIIDSVIKHRKASDCIGNMQQNISLLTRKTWIAGSEFAELYLSPATIMGAHVSCM